MALENVIGLVAGTLTTISFLPQVIKVWKHRSTRDLSMTMLIAFTSGVTLWLVYGILTYDLPIIVTNITTLVLSTTILILKLRYK
ncbi:MAG: SemiSWEET transporter [Pyrinomonadaceae bacterium]